jgi:hypothetical protein
MQNLYKYLRDLQSLKLHEKSHTEKVLEDFRNLNEIIKENPIEKSFVISTQWELPYSKAIRDYHYNILYIFAKHFQVKLMWRDLLPPDASIIHHGLWVIGESERVQIWIGFMSYFFQGYYGYSQWLRTSCKEEAKKAGYADTRGYASKQLEVHRDTIYIYVKNQLDIDHSAELRLENIIKEQFKLDYKKYNTDHPEYYHAISRHFHHKRMLL